MIFTEALKKNDDFRRVYELKKSKGNRFFIMYVSDYIPEKNRLGISVSKKTGNSVVRHRIKRLVRESYRLNESRFSSGLNIIVVARKEAADISFKETESAILHLAKKQGILIDK
jgi:ribonuclease P protein component